MKNYNTTIKASYLGYVVQAIVNNFVPLLFVHMQSEFGIPLSQITLLITFNFLLQLLIDMFSTPVIEKIGYRASMIVSNATVIAGLLLLTVLPGRFSNPFVGVLISVCIYAVGGGIQEVLVSPIVEACPSENKETQMSLLHSTYCWGHLSVVLLSTFFFATVGIENWRMLAVLWCIVPVPVPVIALLGCGLVGFSVGIFWPGTFSTASAMVKGRGTLLFALLALAGDLGCSGGPTLVGTVASHFNDNLKSGMGAAIVFPAIMGAGLLILGLYSPDENERK